MKPPPRLVCVAARPETATVDNADDDETALHHREDVWRRRWTNRLVAYAHHRAPSHRRPGTRRQRRRWSVAVSEAQRLRLCPMSRRAVVSDRKCRHLVDDAGRRPSADVLLTVAAEWPSTWSRSNDELSACMVVRDWLFKPALAK